MKHELPTDWLGAYLDRELAPDELTAAEARLAQNSTDLDELSQLRELDQKLRRVLVPPTFSESRFLAELERSSTPTSGTSNALTTVSLRCDVDPLSPSHRSVWARTVTVTTVMLILSAVAVLFFVNPFAGAPTGIIANGAELGVARVVRMVGLVDYRGPQESSWKRCDVGTAVPIVAGGRLRTPASSLCEVETVAREVLRLNQQTELIVHNAEQIQLVTGELWCSTAASSQFTILVPGGRQNMETSPTATGLQQFQCPSNSETQWSVQEQGTKCVGVSDTMTELTRTGLNRTDLKTPSIFSCPVEPGQSWLVMNENTPVATGREDRLLAIGWQLPLLATRQPDDPELQNHLQSLLARIGQTKMSSLYDSQIRRLGPPGTIPLIAFVRSPASRDKPALRHHAMQIIADLAPESTRSDLEVLVSDSDPTVSKFASAALARLLKHRSG
ncbi:MAG: hypothetical protein O2856_12070 [Planctomycetota bacterium]|nr:hypothetical protein [Planctomycetota bacterium]